MLVGKRFERNTVRNGMKLSIAVILMAGVCSAFPSMDVMVEHGVKATMRDGVVLRADIYRPKEAGRYPVLLQRTPYNKANGVDFGMRAAAAGYVAIVQDVRGRFTSEGEWYPFKWESQDGFDTVEWAAALPYSNGKVGMWGGSYVGATQMLTAMAHPPHLAGILPVVTASNYHSNWTYQGGAFEQWFNESWTSGLAQDTLSRKIQAETNAMDGAWKLPLTSYPLFNAPGGVAQLDSAQGLAPYFLDWLAHPSYDEYWKRWSIEDHYADIQVPALHVAAWYDIFQGGSLRNYEGLKEHAGNEAARNGQRLLVIIGGHAGGGRQIGEVDFGPAADFDETQVTLDWYEFLLKGVQNEFAKHPVRIFVMGANEWRDEDEWPLRRAKAVNYFLGSSKGANSLRGDGVLQTGAGGSGRDSDEFVYDPANPVPTTGGPLCCDATHLPPGPRDQRAVEARDDVLVYSTPALEHDVEVSGQVTLTFWAKSSAVDTDFTAKLLDIWPNGFAQNLTDGIVRARYRDSQEKPELLNPQEIYKLSLDLWSTSNVFKKGHKIRLEVSSSNFPRFDRNLNTGESGQFGTRMVKATNTVLHDAEHTSVLVLPQVSQK
jgi:putative CocE/NonD family hydrolase